MLLQASDVEQLLAKVATFRQLAQVVDNVNTFAFLQQNVNHIQNLVIILEKKFFQVSKNVLPKPISNKNLTIN